MKAIDEALLQRKELHLIDGQPSKPIRKPGELASKISAFKPKPKAPLHVRGDGSTLKDGQSVFRAMMGKRASPPTNAEPVARKKLKLSPCPLCKADHHGILEECPFVRAGPKS